MERSGSVSATSGQISRTQQYERSRQVEVAREVRREQGAETEISTKTTTEKTVETTRVRRELESRIRELNRKLDELGRGSSQFELSSGDEPVIRLVDDSGRTFDLKRNVDEFLAADPAEQSGLLVNTVI
ncbi:MAG: hypothetical protein BM485_02480 [Desulfobulbaceae bacterium DB1]|nr:MAG: hypothetical protein BM485_02480 [Desulfobulbaceae bacterium DB1]